MKPIKKIVCALLVLLMIPLTGCDLSDFFNLSNGEKHKLSIKDSNHIILNIDEICEPNETYGLYEEGDEITFEIKFFSGLCASLSIDGTDYRPTSREAWEPEYITYTVPDHDVDVVSLLNGFDGERIEPTGTFPLTVIDEHDYIFDKPAAEYSYFAPGTEIVLHAYPLMDADLVLYVDGAFYAREDGIETDDGYVWEYRFTMPIGPATLEFKVEGGM